MFNKPKWTRIIELYGHTKDLILCGEEWSEELTAFIQPVLEHRNAYDHLIRILAARPTAKDFPDDDDIIDLEDSLDVIADASRERAIHLNLHAMWRHQFRAFFDVADFLSIQLRKQIVDVLGPYSNANITTIFPEYYTSIRPELSTIIFDIVEIRKRKDLGRESEILEQVLLYKSKLNRLSQFLMEARNKIPALEEYRRKERRDRFWGGLALGVLYSVIAGLVLWGMTSGTSYLLSHKPQPDTPSTVFPAGPSTK